MKLAPSTGLVCVRLGTHVGGGIARLLLLRHRPRPLKDRFLTMSAALVAMAGDEVEVAGAGAGGQRAYGCLPHGKANEVHKNGQRGMTSSCLGLRLSARARAPQAHC